MLPIPIQSIPMGADVLKNLPKFLGLDRLSGLFSWAPRGDYQKFQRIILPTMKSAALSKGYPIYAYWFGELIEVDQYGRWGVIYPSEPGLEVSLTQALLHLQDMKGWLDTWGVLKCDGVSFAGATAEDVARLCSIDVYGPGAVLGGGGNTGGGIQPTQSGFTWLAAALIVGAGVYLFAKGKI